MIKGAAIKANVLGVGLVTFMTFTCAPEDRERVAYGEITLGREMKRTLNAMQERFRREESGSFVYIWVAENPDDSNPHVHLLTNHHVPRDEFDALAKWVEKLWGHGWVKIERIHNPESAGRYILKAVGYTLKGESGNQGSVYGNRYGISRLIRTDECTFNIEDREDAAEGLYLLEGDMEPGSDVEVLTDGVFLTRYGVAFGAGTPMEVIGRFVEVLGQALGEG